MTETKKSLGKMYLMHLLYATNIVWPMSHLISLTARSLWPTLQPVSREDWNVLAIQLESSQVVILHSFVFFSHLLLSTEDVCLYNNQMALVCTCQSAKKIEFYTQQQCFFSDTIKINPRPYCEQCHEETIFCITGQKEACIMDVRLAKILNSQVCWEETRPLMFNV